MPELSRERLERYLTGLTSGPVREYLRPNLFANTPDILHAYLQQGGPPAFRIRFVLAATLTLLPAVLAKLGPRVDRLSLPWAHSGDHRSARFARWGERLWRRPYVFGGAAALALVLLALPVLGLRTSMPSITVVPNGDDSRLGYAEIARGFGPGAPGSLQVVSPAAGSRRAAAVLASDPGVAAADLLQKRRGKRPLPADDETDAFRHGYRILPVAVVSRAPRCTAGSSAPSTASREPTHPRSGARYRSPCPRARSTGRGCPRRPGRPGRWRE